MPPTTSNRPHVVPPGAPPAAGVRNAPPSTPPDANKSTEDMVKALLQDVMTKEDFSKCEKMVMPPPPKKEERRKLREEELWRQCQKEENLKKQIQVHLEQVKKHEHNLEQQKMMLADVQLWLESVSLEVKALRASVAETKEPEEPPYSSPVACSSRTPSR